MSVLECKSPEHLYQSERRDIIIIPPRKAKELLQCFPPQAIANSNGANDWLIPNETRFQTERQWHMFTDDERYEQQSNEAD